MLDRLRRTISALADPVAKGVGIASRFARRGGGTTLPGLVLLRLDPEAIERLSAPIEYGTLLCSATNGKTTTTRLIDAGISSLGISCVSNSAGSNLERGIATTLLKAGDAELCVLEVDEAALCQIATRLRPRIIVLMNLFQDQTDRFGSVENLVSKWERLIDSFSSLPEDQQPTLVLNADDPNLVMISASYPKVIYFGSTLTSSQNPVSSSQNPSRPGHRPTCRTCKAPIEQLSEVIGHLGNWQCSNPQCATTRPTPAVTLTDFTESETGGIVVSISSPASSEPAQISSKLIGMYSGYNLLAAFAAVYTFSVSAGIELNTERLARCLGAQQPAFGRGEILFIDGIEVAMLLAKNATGADQNLIAMGSHTSSAKGLHLLIVLNNRIADGKDISWIDDVDFESYKDSIESLTLSGDCVEQLEKRILDAGFDPDKIASKADSTQALELAIARCRLDSDAQRLWVMPSYTSLLELQGWLSEHGHRDEYWR